MKNLIGIFYAIISSGTFGLIALFSIPLMKDGMSTESVLFYRFLISSIVMGAICVVRRESLKIEKRHIAPVFGLGLLYAATALFLIQSYHWIPSGVATTIHFIYPILVSVLMVAFFRERGSFVLFGAALMSLLGVLLMCWTDTSNIRYQGIITASLTILTYALYIVGINQTKTGKEIPAEPLTFWVLASSTFIFFFYGITTTGIGAIPDLPAFGRLAGLAIFSTVISDLTLILAIKYIGSTVTSILGSMEPLVAMSIGVLYFSETFTVYTLIGIVLIIISVCLVIGQSAKKESVIK